MPSERLNRVGGRQHADTAKCTKARPPSQRIGLFFYWGGPARRFGRRGNPRSREGFHITPGAEIPFVKCLMSPLRDGTRLQW
jgi:hypothetical protein